jgi:hypothetical protein
VRLIRKAAIEPDLRDRRVARCQQSLRPLEAQPGQAPIRRFAIGLLEHPNEVEAADIGDFREILQGDLFGEVRVQCSAINAFGDRPVIGETVWDSYGMMALC